MIAIDLRRRLHLLRAFAAERCCGIGGPGGAGAEERGAGLLRGSGGCGWEADVGGVAGRGTEEEKRWWGPLGVGTRGG